MIALTIIGSILYYVGDGITFPSYASGSYVGSNETVSFKGAAGGGDHPVIAAAERPVLIVGLGTYNREGLNVDIENGLTGIIDYYEDYMPTVQNTSTAITIVGNRVNNEIHSNKARLAWYQPGEDYWRTTGSHSSQWQGSLIVAMDSNTDPTGGAGIYRDGLNALAQQSQLGNWKSLVNDNTKAVSRQLWGYFGTLLSSGSSYRFDSENRIKTYMGINGLDFNNIKGWTEEESQKAAIAHIDLLMTLYSVVEGSVPDAAEQYENAINDYIENGTQPGQVTPTCNIVLYPGVAWDDDRDGSSYITSIYDVWNYTYGVRMDNYLGSDAFKGIAEITGASSASELYTQLHTNNMWLFTALANAGQAPSILGKGAFSYVNNYSFGKVTNYNPPFALRTNTNSRKFAESLYLDPNKQHYGINVIIAPPSQFEVAGQFDADFSIIWSRANASHFTADGDNVNDVVQFKVNMKVPDADRPTWNAIFDKYDKFQIGFNLVSTDKTGRVSVNESEGGQSSPLGAPSYNLNGGSYNSGGTVDINEEELKRYLLNGNVYMGLTDIITKNQVINYGELQTYGYNLQVIIKYGNSDADMQTMTSSWTGWEYDKNEDGTYNKGAQKKHQVTVNRVGDPLTHIVYYSSPEAFAEFKEGTVERHSNGSDETFDAMAGVPSTETMYFTSGGSEFIVELELEFIQRERAWRKYVDVFFGTECEFKRNDQFRSSATAGNGNGGFSGNFNTNGQSSFSATFVADENGNDQQIVQQDQWMYMYVAEGADSYTNAYNGHDASLPTPHEKDKNSYNSSTAEQSNKSSNTTFTAVWTGKIPNASPTKGSQDHALDNYEQGNPAPSEHGGQPGYAGDFIENDTKWDVSALQQAAKQAHDWAAKYEATNNDSHGTASKIADSDGQERIWKIGNATISVEITGGRASGDGTTTGSYYGGSYTTGNISAVETITGDVNNFGNNHSFKHGTDGTVGTCTKDPGPPPVHEDSNGTSTVKSTVSVVGDLSYKIVVTFDNGTLSAHELCGPECIHDLPRIFDNWVQRYEYDYARLNVARVYKIHRSQVDGMEEITLVDYNDPEDKAQNEFFMEYMHGSLNSGGFNRGRYENITAAKQSSTHTGTDTIVAAISQGDPNIFYNIANMQPQYNRTSGSNKEADRPAMAGRMRSTYQVQQMDYVYIEEMTRRGNIGWASDYSCTTGSRSNKCDGLGATIDGQNPIPVDAGGHATKWANGILYDRGYQNYTGLTEDEQYWMTDEYGNEGLAEQRGKGKVKTGYDGTYLDDKDVLTEEYARFKYRRNSKNTLYIVSDMLLLQTSTGDQPVIYYVSPPQAQTLQKWYEYDDADRQKHAAKGVPLEGTLFKNKMENIWNNNDNAACNWGVNNIGQRGDVNVGSYTGEYQVPDNKFSSTTNGKRFTTIYDHTNGIYKLNDLDAACGHPLQWVDQFYGPGGGDSANRDNQDYGANKASFKKKYVGRNQTGFEANSSSVVPGSLYYETINPVIDEVDAHDYKSSPNRMMKDGTVANPDNYADDYTGQLRMERPNGLRIFTDEIIQDPTNENKEYETGNAYQDYIMILDWDKSPSFYHEFEPTPVYIQDRDDGKTVDGCTLDATYSREHEKINDIVVHSPVSVEDGIVVHSDPDHDNYDGDNYTWEEDFTKDSRTTNELLGATNLREELDKLDVCPGDAELCDFRILDCSFDEDKVLANFTFEKEYTASDGTKKTGVRYENGRTYVTNTINDKVYELPNGFNVNSMKQVNGAYKPHDVLGNVIEDKDIATIWLNNDGDEELHYTQVFGDPYGNYLKAYGTRWSIPISDLMGGFDSQTKLAIEMNIYKPKQLDTGTMFVSFNNYAFFIPGGSSNAGWNTGNGMAKAIKDTSFVDQSMKLKLIFDFGDPNDSKVYINGQEVTNYSLGKLDSVKDSIGSSINIGSWGKNNDYPASFYIDNLKIIRIAGERQHDENCYQTVKQHSQTIQYTCQVEKEFVYNQGSKGEPELYTIPNSGKYKIEAYGAQGGGAGDLSKASHGGYGGYSFGFTHFNRGDQILVYAGGQGSEATSSGEIYGWTLQTGCGNYSKFAAAADEMMSGLDYTNSVTGKKEESNATLPVIWSETTPTGFECNKHSVSIAVKSSTGELLKKVATGASNASVYATNVSQIADKRAGGTYYAGDFWYSSGTYTKNGNSLTSNGAHHLSGPNLQGIAGMRYRVTYYGANLNRVTPTVWDDYKSSTSQNTSWTIVSQTSNKLVYEITLGSKVSNNAQTEFCFTAKASGVRVDKCEILPLKYKISSEGTLEFNYTSVGPQIYTAGSAGDYQVEVYGAQGGNDTHNGGQGGTTKGTVKLNSGQQLIVYPGQAGSATSTGNGGGFNGGGHAGNSGTSGAGGGASDIALINNTTSKYQDANTMSGMSGSGATLKNGVLSLPNSSSFYWGPRITSTRGHIYRVDFYGTNLTRAYFDTYVYTQFNPNKTAHNNATLVWSKVESDHAQFYWKVNTSSAALGQEFRVFGGSGVTLSGMTVIDLNTDRIMVAGGGGGGGNKSAGGNGGGTNGANGGSGAAGGTQSSGNALGYGGTPGSRDGAGAGGGYYGGRAPSTDDGAGGGSGYIKSGTVTGGTTTAGGRTGDGLIKITAPVAFGYKNTESAGWNGGGIAGTSGPSAAHGYGGGGATDIRVLKYGGIYRVGSGIYDGDNIWYGPYINAGKGHYQADIYGTNLDKAEYDIYLNASTTPANKTYKITEYRVSPTHVTLYFEVTEDIVGDGAGKGLEVRTHGASAKVDRMYISRLEDRIIVAGGGGGADNAGGTLNGADDGSGGGGGGATAGNGKVEGVATKPGVALTPDLQAGVDKRKGAHGEWVSIGGVAKSGCGLGAGQDFGFSLGVGESATYPTDTGGAGGGYHGGYVTNHNNGGAGGGSGYIGNLSASGMTTSANAGSGHAWIKFIEHEPSTAAIPEMLVGSYDYTGGVQKFTAAVSGTYRFDVWGAAGGDARVGNTNTLVTNSGGAGGFASGTKYLKAGQTVYIYVGQKGGDAPSTAQSYGKGGWNGGGDGGTEPKSENQPENGAGGGGASDVRTSTNLADRFIVAGGGGGAGSSVKKPTGTSTAGLVTKQENGKTWARVLYQNITGNKNYFTTSNMGNVNQEGLYSILDSLEQFRGDDGKFEFMLEYPDATGIFAGKKNIWKQSANPYTYRNGYSSNQDAQGYVGIQNDMPSYGGNGLEYNGGPCVLDGLVGHGNWWLCVGIMNQDYDDTNTQSKPHTMPGPTNGKSNQGVAECALWVRIDNVSGLQDGIDAGAVGTDDPAYGGPGGGETGLMYNRSQSTSWGKGGTQTSGYQKGQGQKGYSQPSGSNLGSTGGAGGGYYGGTTSKTPNDNAHGGPGGSGYVGGVDSNQLISGASIMPSVGGGQETGHRGNGHVNIYMSNNESEYSHNDECTFVSDQNNVHVHNAGCITLSNQRLKQALNAAYSGDVTLLRDMLSSTIYNKITTKGSGKDTVKIDIKTALGLDGTEAGLRKAISVIQKYAGDIPDNMYGEFNPIFNCNRLYNQHVCDDRCGDEIRVLVCTEPHHSGMHYQSEAEAKAHGRDYCYDACFNDENHKENKDEIINTDGNIVKQEIFINTDEYFDIYFPNNGDFYESDLHGIGTTTSTRGIGYEDGMDTSMWTREKYVKFSVDVLFYREETKKWEQYSAGDWIELPVKGHSYPYYHFYCTLNNSEMSAATAEFEVEAINAQGAISKYNYKNYGYERYDGTKFKYDTDYDFYEIDGTNHGMEDFIYQNYDAYRNERETVDELGGKSVYKSASNHENNNDNQAEQTNKDRSRTLRALHGAHKTYRYDVVGRIGNLFITDSDDLRFSNLFKLPKVGGEWLIDGIVREVYENIQNYYLSWHYDDSTLARDVRNRLVDRKHNMYNIWLTQKWNGAYDDPVSATKDHAIEIPLGSSTSTDKNPAQLEGDLLKPGYSVNFEITTTGNYGASENILRVKPYFYALAVAEDRLPDGTTVTPGTLIPVDVHMKTEDDYQTINYFGAVDNTETWEDEFKGKVYDFDQALRWDDEYLRRNYTDEEQIMTDNLRTAMADVQTDENGNVTGEIPLYTVGGSYYSLGNAQIIEADGHARSFIGTNNTVYEDDTFNGGYDTNFDDRFNSLMYNYRAQRWHLKLGIPSSAAFTMYLDGKHINPTDTVTYNGQDMQAADVISESGKYVIVMTANIKSIGDTWILYYGQDVDKGRQLAQDENDWSNGHIQVNGVNYNFHYLGSYDDDGKLIPSEFRVVLAAYDASNTAEVDYDIIGTH